VFEAVGERAAGRIDDARLKAIECHACPGAGSCGGMFTANTMSSAIEALGLSLPYSSTMAAEDEEKAESAAESARVLVAGGASGPHAAEDPDARGVPERDRGGDGVGGSTNAVLHLLAIAHAAGVPLKLDDFEAVRARVPVLCDLKPSGRYVATDLHEAGGIPQVMKILLKNGVLDGTALTISGKTLAETLAGVPDEPPAGQDVIRPWSRPVYAQGHLAILRGNLARRARSRRSAASRRRASAGPRGCSSPRRSA
jgi:dihydroxy-acid dehydratase